MMDSPSGVSCSAVVCANDISGPVKYDKFSLALKFIAANRPQRDPREKVHRKSAVCNG